MKKLTTLVISLILISFSAIGQHGFVIEYLGGGPLETIDLLTAVKTPVGTTMNNFGAGDFGANEVFYAINSSTNQFYQIDTIDGTTTLVGAITPPADHMWTGMAYDEANDIMYGYSAYAIAAGEGSLHIIDVSNGSYTLVGTQTAATAIGCIAIDGSGQMYGLQEEASADIYLIDITTGAVTVLGPIGQGAAGMGHGMDYCNANQTMYLTTYNSMTMANTLRTVNLANGSTTQVGGLLGGWTGVIAIPGSTPLSADFTADVTDVCVGGVVNYTDQSSSATSWSWTFEGGSPPTSTDQNPTVTYNTTGTFDVTLEVSDGTNTDTDYEEDMITVNEMPLPEITGETIVCKDDVETYSTEDNTGSTYNWEVQGGDILSGAGTNEITILWPTIGTGTVLVTETSAAECEGASDTLFVLVDECPGIEEETVGGVSLYPNPAKDQITITFTLGNTTAYEIVIFNQFGQQVYTAQANAGGQGSHQINTASLPTGLYFVKMKTSSNEVYQTRFEVVR